MYRKHSSFSFITVLYVPRLSEHERPGAIGMLKAGMRVSDVTWYCNCLFLTIQRLRDRYQAISDAGLVNQNDGLTSRQQLDVSRRRVYRRYLHRRYPFQLATVSASRQLGLPG